MSTNCRISGKANDDNTFRSLSKDYQTVAYGATIALVTKQQAHDTLVSVAQLTGNPTLSINVGDDTADDVAPFVGDTLRLLLASDATTRTVTFGTGFASTGTLAVTTGKFASVSFIFNGSVWQETGRTVTA